MYLSAPLMQTAGRVPACSFACDSLVRVGAGGRRGSCCVPKGAQTREAGEKGGGCEFDSGVLLSLELGGRRGKGAGRGGTFPCPLRKQGGHAPTFCLPVLFSREGLKRGKRWGGGAHLPSSLRVLFLSHVCESFSCRSGGWGRKGGDASAVCIEV